jgi:hypothetical protein
MNAVQRYTGSGGYDGEAALQGNSISGTLAGTAYLKTTNLRANQIASLIGESAEVSSSLASEGNSVTISSGISSGMISTT